MEREQRDAPPIMIYLEPSQLIAGERRVQSLQGLARLVHDSVPEGGITTTVVLGVILVAHAQLG